MPIRMTPVNMRNKESGKSLIIINKGKLQPKMIKLMEIILRRILLNFRLLSDVPLVLNDK
jgi:hypothetical protein